MTTTKNKAIEQARNGLKKGIWKSVRLVKVDNEATTIIIPWSKVSTEEALNRLDYIKHKLDNDLDSGNYQIQCKMNFTKHGITESFCFEVKERKIVSLSTIPKDNEDSTTTTETTIMPNDIDFDEYIATIKENAELKAMNGVLERERDLYKHLYEDKTPVPLNDSPEQKTMTEKILEGLAGTAPVLLALGEKWMEQRDRKLSLEEKKNTTNKPMAQRIRKRLKPMEEGESKEQLCDRLSLLCDNDPDAFESELDLLEQSDPELYDYVYENLGLEDSEEEE